MNLHEPPALPGVTHRHVYADGKRLHIAEAGRGRPVLMVHGWPQHWWCWRKLIQPLARRRRVLALDLHGFGWSDSAESDYAKTSFARDILAVLDAEGIECCPIIGHDWGGYAAFLLALSCPDRVECLLALDIPPPWSQHAHVRHLALPLLASYQALLATPLLGERLLTSSPRFVRSLIRAGSGADVRWDDEQLDVYAQVLRRPARARASSACYRTFLTRELPSMIAGGDRSQELRVPTLLLMGERSPIRRVLDPRPSRCLRIRTVAGAGHFLPEEAPDEVLSAAAELFERPQPRRA